eukprot:s3814_g7.t1
MHAGVSGASHFPFNIEAPELMSSPDLLPSWTNVVDEIFQTWQLCAAAWEGEPRSAHFLTWYVAPAIGRDHCWFSKRVALQADFWNWKQTLGSRWRDEMDPDHDFSIHFVKTGITHLEAGVAGHIILMQHSRIGHSAVLVSVYDPAVNDGHHFKTVHVVPAGSVPEEISAFGNDLLNLSLGPVHSFASVVKWHENTVAAKESCPDWTIEMPTRVWLYTDGASRFSDANQCRHAAASAVLLIESPDGWRFGGFHALSVPLPATAPMAEHAALLLAHVWCIQLLDWLFHCTGWCGIPVTFAFDCVAAGYAA